MGADVDEAPYRSFNKQVLPTVKTAFNGNVSADDGFFISRGCTW